MFGIGMPEMILILVIGLIVIGPKKLPDLAKALGRAIGEFKKATSDFKDSIEMDYELKDVKKTFNDINSDIKKTIDVNIEQNNTAQKASSSPNDQQKQKTSGENSLKDE